MLKVKIKLDLFDFNFDVGTFVPFFAQKKRNLQSFNFYNGFYVESFSHSFFVAVIHQSLENVVFCQYLLFSERREQL